MAEDLILNSGLPRTNPASDQGGASWLQVQYFNCWATGLSLLTWCLGVPPIFRFFFKLSAISRTSKNKKQRNKNFARASRVFVHFFAVVAQPRVNYLISRFVRTWTQDNDFLIPLLNVLQTVLKNSAPEKIDQHLTGWATRHIKERWILKRREATFTWHRTNFRTAEEFDGTLCSPWTVQYHSVHTEHWTVRRLNFRTLKVDPCERKT